MSLLKYINRLRYMDFMIKKKATGNLENFAKKNDLSKRAMTDIISEMKLLGFPIKYNRTRSTYYYEEGGEMVKQLFIKDGQILSKQQISEIVPLNNLCYSEYKVFKICEDS